jgi:hypothetical protein
MTTRDDLCRHYAGLSDDRLLALAVNEASQLTAEALEVLQKELHARQLDKDLGGVIAIQTRHEDPREIELLVERARKLPCQHCGSKADMLNAATIATVRSFVIFSAFEKDIVVGCPGCLRAAAHNADTTTAALGWWSFPFGPIRSIQALLMNAEAVRATTQQEATTEFREFIAARRGAVLLAVEAHDRSVAGGGGFGGRSWDKLYEPDNR